MRVCQTAALVLISVSVWACGGGHGHSEHHEAGTDVPVGEGSELRLNDGEKWEMDDHTRTLLATMVERVERPRGENESAAELGSALEKDIDVLVRGCTMTGDAHGELHKFLSVLIPAVEDLTSRGSDHEVRTVKELLDSYPRYFE